MSVIEDDAPSIRRFVFPFFDGVEIAFVLLVQGIITGGILLSGLEHKTGPILGALVGMYAVGNLTFPSKVRLPKGYEEKIVLAAEKNGFIAQGNGRYVPDLPRYLRWPRNSIIIETADSVTVRAPNAILRRVMFLVEQ